MMCRRPSFSLLAFCCCCVLPVMVTALDWWLLSVAGLRLLALSPLISLLSFNLSATDTINFSASQPFRVPRHSCKAYNFKAHRVIDNSREGTADKSDYLQRSSKDYFHHKGRGKFRKKCRFNCSSMEEVCCDFVGFVLNSLKGFFGCFYFTPEERYWKVFHGAGHFHCAGVHQSASPGFIIQLFRSSIRSTRSSRWLSGRLDQSTFVTQIARHNLEERISWNHLGEMLSRYHCYPED